MQASVFYWARATLCLSRAWNACEIAFLIVVARNAIYGDRACRACGMRVKLRLDWSRATLCGDGVLLRENLHWTNVPLPARKLQSAVVPLVSTGYRSLY